MLVNSRTCFIYMVGPVHLSRWHAHRWIKCWEESVQAKNQGKRNQGPQLGRSVPRRGNSESSQRDESMRKGERDRDRAKPVGSGHTRTWQAVARISGPAKSRNCSNLHYLVLKNTLKKALESSKWSQTPSLISSSWKKGRQVRVHSFLPGGIQSSDTPQRFFRMDDRRLKKRLNEQQTQELDLCFGFSFPGKSTVGRIVSLLLYNRTGGFRGSTCQDPCMAWNIASPQNMSASTEDENSEKHTTRILLPYRLDVFSFPFLVKTA